MFPRRDENTVRLACRDQRHCDLSEAINQSLANGEDNPSLTASFFFVTGHD